MFLLTLPVFCLAVAGIHFPSVCFDLTMNRMFLSFDASASRRRRTTFSARSLNMLSKTLSLTAVQCSKTRGPRLTADWTIGKCYCTCRHARLSEEWCELSDKVLAMHSSALVKKTGMESTPTLKTG